MERQLNLFQSNYSIQEKFRIGLWVVVEKLTFNCIFIPSAVRVLILRAFGAKIGHSVYIRRSIRVYFPWNLFVGDNCWLGEGVWFINHAPIKIGDDVCISQNAMICSSGHDYKNVSLQYKHKAIVIHDGAWICLSAIILGGSEIGFNSVVSAGETFSGELPDNSIYIKGVNKLIEKSK